jgi:hypothetical protein
MVYIIKINESVSQSLNLLNVFLIELGRKEMGWELKSNGIINYEEHNSNSIIIINMN